MTAVRPRLEGFLGARARELIEASAASDAREAMLSALETCAVMLSALDAIELDRFDLLEVEVPDLSVWNAAAPQVGAALRALSDGTASLSAAYPAPPPITDVDELDFDLLDEGPGPTERVRAGPEIDRSLEEPIERAVSSLVGMLRQDVLSLGRRLRDAHLVSSPSALLGELQEFRARAVQCVEALATALMRPLGAQPASLLLPRYQSELERSLALRDDLAKLAAEVVTDNARAAELGPDALADSAAARLERFWTLTSARNLWARDKAELAAARRAIVAGRAGGDAEAVRTAVEGLARFLELLVESVSKRPELEVYDRENAELGEALLP